MSVFHFGEGRVLIGPGLWEGRPAIFISQSTTKRPVGTLAKQSETEGVLALGETVLTFPTARETIAALRGLFNSQHPDSVHACTEIIKDLGELLEEFGWEEPEEPRKGG